MSKKALDTLVELVNFRIAATGKVPQKKEDGTVEYVNATVFEPEDVENALKLALSAFNMVPTISYIKFTEEEIIDMLSDLLVTYASQLLLARQSLLERGREFQIHDGGQGIAYTPPQLSDFLRLTSRDLHDDWYRSVSDLKSDGGFYNDFVKEPDEPVPGA